MALVLVCRLAVSRDYFPTKPTRTPNRRAELTYPRDGGEAAKAPCCPLIIGLTILDAVAINANVLNVNLDVPIDLSSSTIVDAKVPVSFQST
uniref:Uncharacterized protein n=1 Tax=Oryza meridionalis TaxID=40149 RepID=A0A0E0E2N6_9ORYZ